jgi:hypothetical protein
MIQYRFRCPDHGDFLIEQPMASTTPRHPCPTEPCEFDSPKVLSGHLQFSYGRDQFHDGPMGDGLSLREAERKAVADAHSAGLEPVRV